MAKRPAKGAGQRLTDKQDAFALAYVETGNAAEAYRRAYDVSESARDGWLYVEACQLLDNPKVALRIEELQAQAQRLSIYTLGKAIDEYEEARNLAIKLENPAAAVSAINGKVKLFGLGQPSRVLAEVSGKDGGPIQHEATVSDDLRQALDAIAGKITGGSSASKVAGDSEADADNAAR